MTDKCIYCKEPMVIPAWKFCEKPKCKNKAFKDRKYATGKYVYHKEKCIVGTHEWQRREIDKYCPKCNKYRNELKLIKIKL